MSTLSRLESGQRRPTVELVLRIALALGISPAALIGAPIPADEQAEQLDVATATLIGHKATPLTLRRAGLRAFRLALPPGAPLPPQRAHGGHEWIFVLSGRLRVRIGPHELQMGPGDALEFPGSRPHAFAAAGGVPTQLLALLSGPGELVHTSAQDAVTRTRNGPA